MEVIAFPLVSDVVAFTWTNFSAYPSETDFGSTANSDNEILLMPGNDSTSVSSSAYVSIVPVFFISEQWQVLCSEPSQISAGTTGYLD